MFEYELESRMALYGSIPVMIAHRWVRDWISFQYYSYGLYWEDNFATLKSSLSSLHVEQSEYNYVLTFQGTCTCNASVKLMEATESFSYHSLPQLTVSNMVLI